MYSKGLLVDNVGKINWTMSPLHIPAPVVSLSITPASREDSTKMAKALARFKREDPTFIVSTDPGTKETIVSGEASHTRCGGGW